MLQGVAPCCRVLIMMLFSSLPLVSSVLMTGTISPTSSLCSPSAAARVFLRVPRARGCTRASHARSYGLIETRRCRSISRKNLVTLSPTSMAALNLSLLLFMDLVGSRPSRAVDAVAAAPPAGAVTIMNSLPETGKVKVDGNYTVGYINNTEQNECHRISMWKFPTLAAGSATSIEFTVIPASPTVEETCHLELSLFDFKTQKQVGAAIDIPHTEAASSDPTETVTLDISGHGWVFENAAGSEYYMTISSYTWAVGPTKWCQVNLPWGQATVPEWAVVGQHGPVGRTCGVQPWSPEREYTRDGGAILMKITGTAS